VSGGRETNYTKATKKNEAQETGSFHKRIEIREKYPRQSWNGAPGQDNPALADLKIGHHNGCQTKGDQVTWRVMLSERRATR